MADINGTNNDDVLYSLNESDSISAGVGNDIIYAGQENDTIYGGGDIDTLRILGDSADYWTTSSGFSASTFGLGGVAFSTYDPIVELGGIGNSSYSLYIRSVEILQFNDKTLYWDGFGWDKKQSFTLGDDTVNGSSQNEFMDGQNGNDILSGMKGDDLLYGGNGDDSLLGGTGNDFVIGDMGNDTLRGGEGNDLLCGMHDADLLYGGKGDDTLRGLWGDDLLYGDTGNDILEAYIGNDTLYGGEGDDLICISSGEHTLYGGKGIDTFFVYRFTDSYKVLINDFKQGQDIIDVSLTEYTAVAYGAGSGDTLWYAYEGGNTVIHAPVGDDTIAIKGLLVLTETDFIF